MKPHIFTDFESNGMNPMVAEILTGYFESVGGKTYELNSRINSWSDEAEEIHGITEFEANMFDEKCDAYSKVLEWLPPEFVMICYANPKTQLGFMLYDMVIFQMNLMDHLKVDRIEHLPVKITGLSVHTMAKEAYSKGLFQVITNGESFNVGLHNDAKKYQGSKRRSFRQTIVYYSLFGEFYKSHQAKDDVKAMRRIYETLKEMLETGVSIRQKNQLELI